jgi:hypothetical protein
MSELPRGPDLSGLTIDERARRGPKHRGWALVAGGLATVLLVSTGLVPG